MIEVVEKDFHQVIEGKDEEFKYTIEDRMVEEEKNEKSLAKFDFSTNQDSPHFTWRSAIVGSILGCIVGSSNLYLGLKTGWVFSASLFSAIFSFILIKLTIKFIPTMNPNFTVMENCTASTAATTSGGLNVGFITCIPAMYRLGLLSVDPMDDILRLYFWTLAGATYGMFFSIPLKEWFVVKNELPFPTPRAAAETIQLLHTKYSSEDATGLKTKFYVLFGGFCGSFLINLSAHWITILDKVHVLYWIGKAAESKWLMQFDTLWGWFLEPNFAFLGAGFILPTSTTLSYLLGTIICYGVSGPILMSNKFIVGPSGFKSGGNGTAQSLFLWSGIGLLLFSSFTELFMYSMISLKNTENKLDRLKSLVNSVDLRKLKFGNNKIAVAKEGTGAVVHEKEELEDIPTVAWVSGVVISSVMSCFVMAYFFQIPIYQTILSIVFAFLLGMVAIQATAETDINPISTLAKVVQVVFVNFPANSLLDLQRNNMLTACITAAAAAQSADMVQDLKTGQLLNASPKSQFYAQLVGTVFGVAYSVPLFLLYAKAYPCIIQNSDQCEFGMASAIAWQNTTILLTTGLQLPTSATILAICFSVFAILFTIFKHVFVNKKYHNYLLNLNALGVGFIISQPSIPIIMALGLLVNYSWRIYSPESNRQLSLGLGAGFIAGAGICAALKAAFTILGLQGNLITWGSIPI